jgi:hypothetical protein
MTTITKTILLASSAAILAVTGMISAVDAAKSGDRSGGAKQHQSSTKAARESLAPETGPESAYPAAGQESTPMGAG